MRKVYFLLSCNLFMLTVSVFAQDKLYTNEFSLGDVELLDGPLKKAMDLNVQTLLKYEVDRLLEPFLKQAGITPKGSPFANWDGLSGHIGGHYLSAMAIHFAATGDSVCKQRMEYMISELKACQDKNGNGYVGGVPQSSNMWNGVKSGNFDLYHSVWVPWYNIHKTYAGLRDAWLYAGNEMAKDMFLKLCDWGIDITSGLSSSQIQSMLDTEFGGMNEVYADAYQITGETKYLVEAKKYTHNILFNSLVAKTDNLNNMHANTQIPKVVGFKRIAMVDKTAGSYNSAAQFFWETVVNNRSLSLGGNSRSEHFPSAASCVDYTTNREGPESCNTYNMLKLTEGLFNEDPQAKYADYYERALFNHILSTQHPIHGNYVYFTPARPRHYRVYSDVNKAMWCCVGSGMENHGKYGQFVYTHHGNDSLYINLFVASKLNWKAKGVEILQETNFPDADSSKITILTPSPSLFKLFLRHPSWVTNDTYQILINGSEVNETSVPGSYICLNRTWQNGDVIVIKYPMQNTLISMPNVPQYVSVMHGPILLGAKTGTNNLVGLVADDSRWGHIANGALESLSEAPIIVGDREAITNKIEKVEGESLTFKASALFERQPNWQDITFEPFFRIHDARYMMYWMTLSEKEYESIIQNIDDEQKEALKLDSLTIDKIATGEQQPDADHRVNGLNSYTGIHNDTYYRDAREGGYFSYQLNTKGLTNLKLMIKYWGNENGRRTFDILVDNVIIATENVSGKWGKNEFVNVNYDIPVSLLASKTFITVKFQAKASNSAGGVFYLRLLEDDEATVEINQSRYKKDELIISPNPTNGIVELYFSGIIGSEVTIELYNNEGKLIKTNIEPITNNKVTLDLTNHESGMFLLRLKTSHTIYSTKFIKY